MFWKQLIKQAALFTVGIMTIPVLATGIVTDFVMRSSETAVALNDVEECVHHAAWIAFVGAFLFKETLWRRFRLNGWIGRTVAFVGAYLVLFFVAIAVF